jgi:hypothetical protein
MAKALNAAGKLIDRPIVSDADRMAAKVQADARKATRLAARTNADKSAKLIIPPTQDPKHAGALWNNKGNLAISAG